MVRKKAKGNKKGRPFEILVARMLSLWWTNGEDEFVFYHSHSSGAMATSRAKRDRDASGHHGDIAYVKAVGEPLIKLICVECKKGYNKSTVIDFIDGGRFKHEYHKWVIKARRDMRATGAKYWWIIHRRDAKDILLTCPQKFWDALYSLNEQTRKRLMHSSLPGTTTIARTKGNKYVKLVTAPLQEFLKVIQPKNIKEML